MHNFKDLIVWQKAIDYVVSIYEITKSYPDSERFNLISQMQRSATSIPLNISEGCGRHTNALFKQFLSISLGSSYELETQLIISRRLGFISIEMETEIMEPLRQIQRMLNKLMNTL